MLKAYSPGKVNLFLKVLGKRVDGYHELLTVFQTIDLGDQLSFTLGHEGLRLTCSAELPSGPGNLVYRAAQAFYRRLGRAPEVTIVLDKQIPMQAGLGGGSSNAATTLRCLSSLYGEALSASVLHELAVELGSDVPYFLGGGTALGTGRGEQVAWLPDLPPFWVRVVCPSFGLSTSEVYSRWEGSSEASWQKAEQALASFSLRNLMSNDLESVAFKMRPELHSLKEHLVERGAEAAMLSGSGSCVFAVYFDRPQAEIVLPVGYRQWLVRSLPRNEESQIGRRVLLGRKDGTN